MLWLNPVVGRVNLPSAPTYPTWRSRRVRFFFFSVKAFKHISQKCSWITISNESNINQMMFETSLPIVYRTRRKPLLTFKGLKSTNHLNLIWCLYLQIQIGFSVCCFKPSLNLGLPIILLLSNALCNLFIEGKSCFLYLSSLASCGYDWTVLDTFLGLWKEPVKAIIPSIYS